MFRRRKKRSLFANFREFFWPSIGWWRTYKYLRHRLLRLSDTTYSIAAGLAAGSCVSFTPFFGFHFVLALGLSWIVAGNYLAAVIGTAFGNPWTFPILMLTSYEVGTTVLAWLGYTSYTDLPKDLRIDYILDNFGRIYVPISVGGILCALMAWPVFLLPYYYGVKSAQLARKLRRLHRVKQHRNAIRRNAHEAHGNPD